METIVGMFATRDQAMQAIEALHQEGYGDAEIGLLMRDEIQSELDIERKERREGMGESAALGAFGGGVIGGLGGLAIGLTGLIIPGIGPALVAGTLAGLVGGAAVGATAGGIVGSLIELGVPHEQAHLYQTGVERGGVLLTVNVPAESRGTVRTLLEQHGLHDVHEPSSRKKTEHAWSAPPEAAAASHEGLVLAVGATGGVVGAIAGGFIAGPAGAAIGSALGMATGAMAGSVSESSEETAAKEGRQRAGNSHQPVKDHVPSKH
jgi:hypothetical protein